MKTQKITEEGIRELKISALPTRPTSPTDFGGRGYTSQQMKAAFDRLPLYIIERFNLLIDDITALGEESLAGAIKTGIKEGHSLASIFEDIQSGRFSEYFMIGEDSLAMEIASIKERLSRLEETK